MSHLRSFRVNRGPTSPKEMQDESPSDIAIYGPGDLRDSKRSSFVGMRMQQCVIDENFVPPSSGWRPFRNSVQVMLTNPYLFFLLKTGSPHICTWLHLAVSQRSKGEQLES